LAITLPVEASFEDDQWPVVISSSLIAGAGRGRERI
jgi:hypothetical protein